MFFRREGLDVGFITVVLVLVNFLFILDFIVFLCLRGLIILVLFSFLLLGNERRIIRGSFVEVCDWVNVCFVNKFLGR